MKSVIFGLLATLTFSANVHAKTRVAVSTFTDKTGNSSRCRISWWGGHELGEGFRDQIVTALMKDGKYEIVERENLKTMYNEEHELINADKSTLPTKNKFRAAHYSITGAVTSFELCDDGFGGKADVGGLLGFKGAGLKLGAKTQKAKVVIDLRVIDVTTSQVVHSFRSEGTASSTKIDADGDIKGAKIGSDAFFSTPIGEATRDAIENAVSQITVKVPDRKEEVVAQATPVAAPVAVIPSKAADVGRSATLKVAPKVSNLQTSQTQVNHICTYSHYVELAVGTIYNGETVVDCKPLRMSSTGKRVSVLYMNDAKEDLIETKRVLNIEPLKVAPKVGQKVYARGAGRFSIACKVIDTDGSNVVAICGKKEITTDIGQLFIGAPFKMPAEKMAVSRL